MPLELKPPRPGRSPYWYVRGTHRGVSLDRSTKETSRAAAARWLKKWRDEIDSGELAVAGEPIFFDAAVNYMGATGNERYVQPVLDHLGLLPLSRIDQQTVDAAALAILPVASPATRNRHIHTIVSAILKHAGIEWKMRRPKGWRSPKRVTWLEPDQAFRVIAEADRIEAEFGLFLRTLLYTGMRLSEALNIRVGAVNLREAAIYLPRTKNDDPRTVFLPPYLVAAFANQPPRTARPRRGDGPALPLGAAGKSPADAGVPFMERDDGAFLFRFTNSGRLRKMFDLAKERAGVTLPFGQAGFHVFRHTWATWMRRYADLDTTGLVETGAWRDRTSAARYEHTTVSEEARKAILLPTPEQAGNSFHGFSTSPAAMFGQRSPSSAEPGFPAYREAIENK